MESLLYNVYLSVSWKAREFLMSATRGQGSSFLSACFTRFYLLF